MDVDVVEAKRGVSLESIALEVICAAYVGWVLSLPVFPTQDGPMHLYFAHVMSALFSGTPGVYGQFYRIKHLLPPYSAYYYLLIGLSRIMPLFLADKLVICGYIVSFCYGFRYLARAVGPAADGASLLATLVVLNWPLGMGFVNFCLGVSLALWTLGVWARAVGRSGPGRKVPGRKALFVGMCWLLVLVHPVPLLAVVGYCTIDVALRWGRRGQGGLKVTRADAVCLVLALTTLGYVKLFTIAHATQQMSPDSLSPLRMAAKSAIEYARGQGLSLFSGFLHGSGWIKRVYRLLLIGVVPLGLGLAARQTVRARGMLRSRGTLWLGLTVGMIAVEPFVPRDMNASHYFAARLLLFVWVGALLAMSGYVGLGQSGRIGLAAMALLGTGATLLTADGPIRRAAVEIVRVERIPVEHAGELGLTLDDWRPDQA